MFSRVRSLCPKRPTFNALLGVHFFVGLTLVLFMAGCFGKDEQVVIRAPAASVCQTLTGSSWTPNVTGAGEGNHNDTHASQGISVIKSAHTTSGLLTGLNQSGWNGTGHVFTISGIDMSTDLLTKGSVSLTAQVTGYPSGLSGGAYPMLISLNDGVQELVNLSGCDSGFYTCTSGSCSAATGCGPDPGGTLGSAYLGASATDRRTHWEQRQLGIAYGVNNNIFPTCNWATGSPSCSFAATPGNFFANSGGKLRSGPGVSYTAKYVVLTDRSTSVGNSYAVNLNLTVVRKRDCDGCSGGGINRGVVDLNVVLVGSKNIQDSRSAKGKQNLDALFNQVYSHYYTENTASTGVKLGKINVYEWTCEAGGDAHANSPDVLELFNAGSRLMPSATEGKALNVFLVSKVEGSNSILGYAGAIGGPPINGTDVSGLVFASFNQIATFNPSCNGSGTCAALSQESSFRDMASTISHEMGHYLGLNHPSERRGTKHDAVPDTPTCLTTHAGTQDSSGLPYIDHYSCWFSDTANVFPATGLSCKDACVGYNGSTTFCALKAECQYNHVMWWTGKYFEEDDLNHNSIADGDGNLFSTSSGAIMNYSPYVQ